MKHRVQIDISFDDRSHAIALLNRIEQIKGNSHLFSGNEAIPCFRVCRYHECYHDNEPPLACGNYIFVDFDGPAIVHT